MATTELKCDRHHTPTQLTCAQCDRPSCPKCLVWTEVGQKCRTCVPGRGTKPRSSFVAPLVVVGVVVGGLLVALGAFSGDDGGTVPERANRGATQPGIGQAARDGSLTFVVTRFDCGAEEVGDAGRRKVALGRYCLLEFTATNTGTQPTTFAAPAQLLLDGQRRRFALDATATAIHQLNGAPGSVPVVVQQMNPGARIETSLVYDIPDGVVPQLAELHAGATLGVTVRLTESDATAE